MSQPNLCSQTIEVEGEVAELVPLEGFAYYVTRSGRLFSLTAANGGPREIAARPARGEKYKSLTLCGNDGRRISTRTHRLVCLTFHGPAPTDQPCVRHLNGDSLDNRAENLAWGSYSDNEADKLDHGTWDLRRNGKLSEADVRQIRDLVASGKTQKEVALLFAVSRPTVTRLVNGSIWSNIK